jgi:mono/diheme cytochrome c family protein/plastocyanin
MSDTPEPGSEQRLPVPREADEVAPVSRFSSPPSARQFDLTPERAAQVVRQSSNARWVGFLAVVVVILFVAIYWFYELGLPGGIGPTPRLEAEAAAQQVTAVERGYNIYEANCARCHGENGEGGSGPVLNRQDKLFAHLNEDYLRNILHVGGRLACGTANSLMPIWSDQGHPPGPLNYRQIEELIAFLRAPSTQEFIVRDEHLLDPVRDPITGEIETFTGWVDPTWQPEPGATPYPACWQDEFLNPSTPAPSGEPTAAPSGEPSGEIVTVIAIGVAFNPDTYTVPANTPFVLRLDNQDPSVPHDVVVRDSGGAEVLKTEIISGPATTDVASDGLAAGSYPFICSIHPNMTGTLTAQ